MSDRNEAVIVDRGYRDYDGPRTGRRGAMLAIIREGYRRALGLRRKARRKIYVWGLIAIATLMLFLQIAGRWAEQNVPGDASLVGTYGEYFDLISVIAILFVAYVGPELLIPDRTQGVLNVYFSRPLSVANYLLAKAGAYAALLLSFYLAPLLIFHLAMAGLSERGFIGYLTGTGDILWKVPATALLYFATFASLAALVAAFMNRVGAAAGVFLAILFGANGIAEFFLQETEAPGARWATLLAIEQHPRYLRDAIFDIDLLNHIPEQGGFEPIASFFVILGLTAAAVVTLVWRYRRLA